MKDQPIFAVGVEEFAASDVLLSALAAGDAAGLEAEIREGIACIRHMLRGGGRPSDAVEEAAAAQFRTERNLLTAAEMEAWLAQRHLSIDNWLRYIRRDLLRKQWHARLPRLLRRYPATPAQLRRALWTVGICSGWLYRFAWKLAGRAAIHARLSKEGQTEEAAAPINSLSTPPQSPPSKAGEAGVAGGEGQVQHFIETWLELSEDVRRAKLTRLARLETSYRCFAEQTATPDALRRQIAARHSEWIRVDYSTHLFAREADAREALLCVHEDGEPLAEVADRSRARTLRTKCLLEQLEPALQTLMLSSPTAEPLGPLARGGESALIMIHEKTLPDAADPGIHALAEQAILSRVVHPEIDQRVQWRARF